jgi:NAD(P)-dependent dehydrogenase (short-subunit alcohol dehydrogenase family)
MQAVSRVALITDVDTPLGDQLARRYLSEGCGVAATRSPGNSVDTPMVSEKEDLLLIDWNRSSPISTKNVLLTALNRFDRIEETVLLSIPQLELKLLQETAAETIDRAVDAWMKGPLFLVKGVLELYGQRNGGRLALVNHVAQEEAVVLPPLESALRGGFIAAAESVFAAIDRRDILVHGFDSRSRKIEELADFICDTMKNKTARSSGKWHRFPVRSGILSALKQ